MAIRKHWKDFAAVLVLIVIAAGVGGYILSNQRLHLPKWVPLVGTDFYKLKADFSTAQAVTPGQGQTVTIAGVNVGEISDVRLEDGRAQVELKIRRKYSKIYRDATILLRPKTGLKDMILELDPGSVTAGEIPEGGSVPVSQTLPDINPDQILAQLDRDTRDYLRLLLGGAGEGLRGNAAALAATFKRFEPTARDGARITRALSARRANLARVVHNFGLLSQALASRDDDLAAFVESSNDVFARLAAQDANIRATLRELPSTLQATQVGLTKANRLAGVLGPTLQALRPTARALGPTNVAVRPFFRETEPIVRTQLRPFARAALPVVRDLRPAAQNLSVLTPNLTTTFRVANYLLNELAYNPPGPEEGYLFWASWANHAANSIFSTQDAHGPIRRGLFLASCSSLGLLKQIASTSPSLQLLIGLTNVPDSAGVCPQQTSPFG
ncbi:MAG TPA: MlaD family protein [Solirubrobacteraceae bacterium]|nr:MlaD family protein [Solirubrobacteraceae bacterium]